MALTINNKKIHIFLYPAQILLSVFAAFLCVLIEISYITATLHSKREEEVTAATIYGQSVASSIILSLDQSINTSFVLKSLYEEFGDSFITNFDKISSHFYDDNPSIGSLYIAPKGIIAAAYPPSVKQSTIGFNMLEDEMQKYKAQLAIDTGKITVAGPLPLIEGGTGLIIRNPSFENGEFSYFSIIAIDWDDFIARVFKSLNHENSGYYVSIWKDENFNTKTDEYGCIVNDKHSEIDKKVQIEITIPNDLWHMSIEPVKGWSKLSSILPLIIFSCIILTSLVVFIVYRQYENNVKLYEFEHDSLTGLLTRSAFYRRVRRLFIENPDEQFDIMVSDIENFKLLNSIYGTKRCDNLLCYLAREFEKITPGSVYARYGGDLFVNIYRSSRSIGRENFENRIKEIVNNAPIPNVVLKFGYYGNVDKTIPPNILCDRTLLAAKSILHNYDATISNYEGQISTKHEKEQILEAAFRNAINNEDFKVWFQPKFDAKTEKLVGAEALVRWIDSNGNIISPSDFIYVFEEDGLIVNLDEYVFRSVCKSIKKFIDLGYKTVPISVNISRASLHHSGVIKKYKNIVEEIGIPIEMVSLEITETTAFQNKQIKDLAKQLKEEGFKIDMDDFGTGSSSLASLNIIPFDVLKIDKSLVDFIGTPDGDELVKHSIELAHFKNIHVIAEGVERLEQLEFLRKFGCDTIQGYYFSPPLSYEQCVNKFKEYYSSGRV